MGFMLFLTSLFGDVHFLKKISMIGILILIYLIIIFAVFLPSYYSEYGNNISFKWISFNKYFFETTGICFYLFCNQYTVIPICNNLKRIKYKRINNVLKNTDLICLSIYIFFTLIGYFSMPDNVLNDKQEEKKWELFLIRPNIGGGINIWVLVG